MLTGAMTQLLRVGLIAVIEACQIGVKPLRLPVLLVVANNASSLDFPDQLSIFFDLLDGWLHIKRIGTVVSRALELIRNRLSWLLEQALTQGDKAHSACLSALVLLCVSCHSSQPSGS